MGREDRSRYKSVLLLTIMDKKERILIVDDEAQIVKIFGLKLKLAGYEVTTTTSGAEAIELARTQKFDVMLLDVLMPGVSGLDVLEKVRTFSQIPVILFSARTDIFDIAKQYGADDYLSKPINPDFLVAKVKALLDEKDNPSRMKSGV